MNESAPVAAAPPPKTRRHVFAARLTSTLILWGVIVAALLWQNEWGIAGVMAFFGLAGVAEYHRLMGAGADMRAHGVLGMLVALGWWIAVFYWMAQHGAEGGGPPMWMDLVALTISLQGGFLLSYRRELEGERTLRRVFAVVFGTLYGVVSFGFLLRVMDCRSGPGMGGLWLALFLILVTKFSDMGAYVIGVLFGRHKMIPHISPAKSWEGLVGAFLGAFGGAALLMGLMADKLAPLTWMHAMVLAPLLCAVAVSGDLAESVLKRCVAIKDSGHKLPGIGGILDLTDSLIFTAPVFYFYLQVLGV